MNDGQLAVSDATVSWLDSFKVSLWMICLPQLMVTFLSDNMLTRFSHQCELVFRHNNLVNHLNEFVYFVASKAPVFNACTI